MGSIHRWHAVHGVTKLEVVDHTICIRTANAASLIPRYGRLSASSGARSAIGASTADYKSGKVAIGTGPFLLASFIVGERAEFARSDGQSDKKPIHQRMHEGVRVWSIKPGS
jgi:peptide/nickel transport system substrate-binding protein